MPENEKKVIEVSKIIKQMGLSDRLSESYQIPSLPQRIADKGKLNLPIQHIGAC